MRQAKYMILDNNNDVCFGFKEFKTEVDAEKFLRYVLGKQYELEKSQYEIVRF